MADTEKRNVVIKQKLTNKIVELYPQTKSSIVDNESTNVTGSTVTDVFNNALPIKAGKYISINPSDTGVEIAFTGPDVTVQGTSEYYNPVEVSGGLNPEKTAATYTVSHKKTGPIAGYTSKNEITTIGKGESKTIKIPQLEVDQFGHVRTAADEDITIIIPSTDGLVAGTGLTKDKIILGNADTNNSSKIQASDYGISNNSTNTNNKDKTIWTQQAVETLINKKITEGAQYLGLVNGFEYNTGKLTYKENESSPTTYITPNSQGDWVRAVKQFSLPYDVNGNGPSETAHVGDILIYHGKNASNLDLWDVIHTEVDTDTWRPIQVGATTLNDSSTTLIISGAGGITTTLNGGTLTLTGTTYTLGQQGNNTVTLTAGETVQKITINNVANATEADHVKNTLTIKLNSGNGGVTTYNGSEAKEINITASQVGAATSNHAHGQINKDGAITNSGEHLRSGDRIVFTDSSDGDKIKRSFLEFDGTSDNYALTQAGIWQPFLKSNQNVTINSGLKHNKQPNDPDAYIKGTAHPTKPTLGKSGIGAGIYSTVEVNEQGIAIAGSQVIKYYASGTTNQQIIDDTMLAEKGFAFVEIA